MAELTTCCAPEAQATCCEPEVKAGCCENHGDGCGCSAGQADVRETVRERYAAAARVAGEGQGCGCGPDVALADRTGQRVFGDAIYAGTDTRGATDAALSASLGCGVPTAFADLHEGETVLDLASGAGADVLISARRVAPTGKAIGLDMTDEMLDLARTNAADAGVRNVEFVKG
jgi:SAM-dependent methyltransferase